MSRKIKNSQEFEACFVEKEKEQREEVRQRLISVGASRGRDVDDNETAAAFYYPTDDRTVCGCAAWPGELNDSFPLLPQLIMTPRLIVSVLPVDREAFEKMYGVTPQQFRDLVNGDHVIPNVYQYYNNGWKEYGKRPYLWDLVVHEKTRINAVWITGYLDSRFGFVNVKREAEEFFSQALSSVSPEEERELITVARREVKTIQDAIPVFAHQLAYLQTLGSSNCRLIEAAENVRKWMTAKGYRTRALTLLRASQHLHYGDFTGAYGGVCHFPESYLEQLRGYIDAELDIVKGATAEELIASLGANVEMLSEAQRMLYVVDRAAGLGIGPLGTAKAPSCPAGVFPLDKSHFVKFLAILDQKDFRDGYPARLAHQIHQALVDDCGDPLSAQAYWRELKALNRHIHSLKPLGWLLGFMSRGIELVVSDMSAELGTGILRLHLGLTGLAEGVQWLADYVGKRDFVAVLPQRRTRVFCRLWRRDWRASRLWRRVRHAIARATANGERRQ